jgi:hypothetical protein
LKPKPKKEEHKKSAPEDKTEAAEVPPSQEESSNNEEPPDDTTVPFYQLPRGYKTYELQHPRERQNPTDPWETVERRLQRLKEEQEQNAAIPDGTVSMQPEKQPEMETGGPVEMPGTMTEPGEPMAEIPQETVEDTVQGQPEGQPCNCMEPGPKYDYLPDSGMGQPIRVPESEPRTDRRNVGMPGQSQMPYTEQDRNLGQPMRQDGMGNTGRNQGMDGTGSQGNMDSHNMDYLKEEKEKPENPLAAKIFESYPRIYPFEDNEITMCVKIEPKDIGYLPVDAWVLSNNSFLMHGYYCYNHLIFAKMKDRFGCRYILGVPGIYHNRERFMARMFGFESFKSIRKRELRQGDFGYWYIPLSM